MAAGRVTSAIGIYDLAAGAGDTPVRLAAIVGAMVERVVADTGYLIVSSRSNRHRVAASRSRDPESDAQNAFVGKSLVNNAWDMGDALLSVNPFASLIGRKGTYDLRSETFNGRSDLGSAIVAPIALDGRMAGALLCYEKTRNTRFSVDD